MIRVAQKLKVLIKQIADNSLTIAGAKFLKKDLLLLKFQQLSLLANETIQLTQLYDSHESQLLEDTIQKGDDVLAESQENKIKIKIIARNEKDSKDTILQVLDRQNLVIFDVINTNYHQKVINNDFFGAPRFNKSENKIVYIAEKKPADTKNFFKQDIETQEDFSQAMKKNQWQQSFGEQCLIKSLGVYLLDLETNTLSEILLPDDIIPAYAAFIDDNRIILQGYKREKEFLYGILHCFNRRSDIFLIDKLESKQLYPKPKKEEEKNKEEKEKVEVKKQSILKVISSETCCFRPIVSPDFKHIVYLATPYRLPHLNYLSIQKLIVSEVLNNNLTSSTIVPIEQENYLIPNTDVQKRLDTFQGFCGFYDDIATLQFLNNDNLIFHTFCGGSQQVYTTNIQNNIIKRLTQTEQQSITETWTLLPVKDSKVFAIKENTFLYPELYDLTEGKPKLVKNLVKSNQIKSIEQSIFSNQKELLLQCDGAEGYLIYHDSQQFECPSFLKEIHEELGINSEIFTQNHQRPLLVLVHGGPHGVSTGLNVLSRNIYQSLGINLLIVNFTGSCGYGQKFIENLLGKIGELDAGQIINLIDQVKDRKLCDPTRIAVMGGSYGGYMSGIMASRYPEYFKCAVLLNAVVNIAFMVNITDIPEWCTAEALNKQHTWNLSSEDYATLLKKSPMLNPPKIPILQLIGAVDLRVPHQASFAYHAMAVEAGTKVETYLYEQANHTLADSVDTSLDVVMKTFLFLIENLFEVKK